MEAPLPAQERLLQARRRRARQLRAWAQREGRSRACKTSERVVRVRFDSGVMLLEAAARGDVEEVRRLLLLGVSPDSTNEDGLTALHQCCIDASEPILRVLLEFGANVNAQDSERWTPLHAAATCGHLKLVALLVERGADLLAVNADGNMPYDICEDEATLDLIESEMAKKGITQALIDQVRATTEREMLADMKWLLENGLNLEYKDTQGATPLHVAAANGYVSVVEFLLQQGVAVDAADRDNWQPIHAAACWSHSLACVQPEVVEMLVQAGAKLDPRTKNGETPYDICEDPELRERLLQLKEAAAKATESSHKPARTHSQNTRCQSVRRTSLREKSQISRREAREEALLWQQDDDDPPPETEDPPPAPSPPSQEPTTIPTEPDQPTKDGTTGFLLDDLVVKDAVQRVRASDDLTVEIHVTVNAFPPGPGTLAELKRQRADLRRRSIGIKNSSSLSDPQIFQPPPSPSVSLKKFRSDPSEIVGPERQLNCCYIL
ncbi:PPP1R16B [Cordylochernes scorpioides]|uniref:PPP1R16B n=1 Tax=Cordylochernes scorpioides TaxID=51811 RepID=A0ABY6LGK8_9ARAC|nr:PPP1R16B [Cordylochernes scorpioides]